MILSKQHGFVFIKGKKVAGTSVEVLLADVCGPDDIITPITPIDEQTRLLSGRRTAQNYGADEKALGDYLQTLKTTPKAHLRDLKIPSGVFYNHMPFQEIAANYADISKDWVIFAVERCPYRKIISMANMDLKFADYRGSGQTMKSTLAELKQRLRFLISNNAITDVKNIDLYKNHAGILRAELLRYEQISDDLAQLLTKLNIYAFPQLQHLKKGLCSNDLDLEDIFTHDQIRIINDLFAEEFESYGYERIGT